MAILAPNIFFRMLDNNGDPLNGGKVYTYEAGTATPKPTYTDESQTTLNTNPIILDASGYARVWLESGSYKFVVNDVNDVLVREEDDISGSSNTTFGASVVEENANFNLNNTYQNTLIIATASLTASLFSAVSAGEGFLFSIQNNSTGVLTLDPDGSETINGASTLVIPPSGGTTVVSDGANWQIISAVTVTAFGDNAFTGTNSFAASSTFNGSVTMNGTSTLTGKVLTPDDGELTISSGAITVTGVYHTVDTELDASTDNLDTISGGADGQMLVIRQENSARDITLTNAGNIVTPDGANIKLASDAEPVALMYDATLTKWVVLSAPLVQATEDRAGISELATQSEANAGTVADKTITPATLKSALIDLFTGGGAGSFYLGMFKATPPTQASGTIITQTGGATLRDAPAGGATGGADLPDGTYVMFGLSDSSHTGANRVHLFYRTA